MNNRNEFLSKIEEIPRHFHYPGSRPVEGIIKNGFLVLDKPPGPTSHDCTAMVKKILNIKKAGHSGTLDPETSGVLLVTLENGCKIMPLLKKLEKEYVAVMHLHKNIDDKKLNKIVKEFTGSISQVPPVKSAVKREERTRKISLLEILDRKEKDVCIRIVCEAGTYVRKLIDDMGKKIGGAHMKELRRIRAGPFSEDEAHTLHELKDIYEFWISKKTDTTSDIKSIVHPIEYALRGAKPVFVKDSSINNIMNGSPVYSSGVVRVNKDIVDGDIVPIMTLNGELVAIGTAKISASDMLRKKALAVKTDRVVMVKSK